MKAGQPLPQRPIPTSPTASAGRPLNLSGWMIDGYGPPLPPRPQPTTPPAPRVYLSQQAAIPITSSQQAPSQPSRYTYGQPSVTAWAPLCDI